MSGLFEFQGALYAVLSEAVAPVKVFDAAPDYGEPFPFLLIGQVAARPVETFSGSHDQVDVTVNVFSEYQGKKEVVDLMAAAAEPLRRGSISIGPDDACSCSVLRMIAAQDRDGVTYTGNLDLRFILKAEEMAS